MIFVCCITSCTEIFLFQGGIIYLLFSFIIYFNLFEVDNFVILQ